MRRTCGLILLCVLLTASVEATVADQMANAPWATKSVGKGVVWKSHHFTDLFNSQQDIDIIDANLNAAGVTVDFPYATGGTRKTVSTFAGTMNGTAAAVVNGQFFDSEGSTQYFRVDGNLITSTNPGAAVGGAVTIGTDGAVNVPLQPSGGWINNPSPDIMACGPVLVENGTIRSFPDNSFTMGRHPRTAVGITADNHLLMITVDGRSTNAAGMTLPELAEVFTALGATTAVNYDGGGSTTNWVRGDGIVNDPSDGQERTVTNAIALVALPPNIVLDTGKVSVSANWQTGTSAADKYGSNYKFRSTEAVSDPAEWDWDALQAGNYEIYAWWSQGSNRSASAPYIISRAGGSTTVNVNQQTNGGSWRSLGTYQVNQGTNSIKLSCWTTTGFVVIADAVKIVARE